MKLKLKIGAKLFLSFGACILILLSIIGYNYYGLSKPHHIEE